MCLFCCTILYLMNFTTRTHTHKGVKNFTGKVCKKHLKTLVVTRTVFVMSGYGHSCLMVPLPIQMQT